MFSLRILKLTAHICDHCYQCMRLAKAPFEVNRSLSVELDQFPKMMGGQNVRARFTRKRPNARWCGACKQMSGSDKLSVREDAMGSAIDTAILVALLFIDDCLKWLMSKVAAQVFGKQLVVPLP
jgi:hypothetical protein